MSTTSTNAELSFTVHNEVKTVHISAVTKDQNAVVTISGDSSPNNYTDAANSASAAIEFPEDGKIYIKVWAEDRSKSVKYKPVLKKTGTREPNANGGNLLITEVDDTYYEIHTFLVDDITESGGQKAGSLAFSKRPDYVEVLVVAGGGGGGKTDDTRRAGGGGAGGYIYVPKYPIPKDSIDVNVGAGGRPPTNYTVAGNGGNSVFGNITAYGGGGGASHADYIASSGMYGGSGGGASASNSGGAATVGKIDGEIVAVKLGSAGGSGNGGGSGGGGGGATGMGSSPPDNVTFKGAMGGAGTQSIISGETRWYAGGGAGGADVVSPPSGAESDLQAYGAIGGNNGDSNTGDGGSGGGGVSGRLSGGKGGSGIVIVRWKHKP
jgi:hypothetical protein